MIYHKWLFRPMMIGEIGADQQLGAGARH